MSQRLWADKCAEVCGRHERPLSGPKPFPLESPQALKNLWATEAQIQAKVFFQTTCSWNSQKLSVEISQGNQRGDLRGDLRGNLQDDFRGGLRGTVLCEHGDSEFTSSFELHYIGLSVLPSNIAIVLGHGCPTILHPHDLQSRKRVWFLLSHRLHKVL